MVFSRIELVHASEFNASIYRLKSLNYLAKTKLSFMKAWFLYVEPELGMKGVFIEIC